MEKYREIKIAEPPGITLAKQMGTEDDEGIKGLYESLRNLLCQDNVMFSRLLDTDFVMVNIADY